MLTRIVCGEPIHPNVVHVEPVWTRPLFGHFLKGWDGVDPNRGYPQHLIDESWEHEPADAQKAYIEGELRGGPAAGRRAWQEWRAAQGLPSPHLLLAPEPTEEDRDEWRFERDLHTWLGMELRQMMAVGIVRSFKMPAEAGGEAAEEGEPDFVIELPDGSTVMLEGKRAPYCEEGELVRARLEDQQVATLRAYACAGHAVFVAVGFDGYAQFARRLRLGTLDSVGRPLLDDAA